MEKKESGSGELLVASLKEKFQQKARDVRQLR